MAKLGKVLLSIFFFIYNAESSFKGDSKGRDKKELVLKQLQGNERSIKFTPDTWDAISKLIDAIIKLYNSLKVEKQ